MLPSAGVRDIPGLVDPAPLVAGSREHLDQRLPQDHRAVADDQLGIAHAAPAAVAQQIRPRLGRLTQALGQRDQLLGAVQAHAHQHQDVGVRLHEPDLGVHPVRPHVHVVGLGEVALLEGGDRDCRLKGDGVHHAMLGAARMHNLNLAG